MKSVSIVLAFWSFYAYILYYNIYEVAENSLVDLEFCAVTKCPFCYGTDLCGEFRNGEFKFKIDSLYYLFTNLISVKNVYYATYKDQVVVLKKLAHYYELHEFDKYIQENYATIKSLNEDFVINDNTNTIKNLHFCTYKTANRFFKQAEIFVNTSNEFSLVTKEQVWYTARINAEPLLLKMLSSSIVPFPIPKYLGACGRLIVEEFGGDALSDFYYADWHNRANISLQLLRTAEVFTYKHELFRFYLTDISPDNIAVDDTMRVRFIDLENVIIVDNLGPVEQNENTHYSVDMEDEDGFAFSPSDICNYALSDHNYYAVCKLLLSKNSPWPMVTGGLLHSPPPYIEQQFPKLFELVELCVRPNLEMNRFHVTDELQIILQEVLVSNV